MISLRNKNSSVIGAISTTQTKACQGSTDPIAALTLSLISIPVIK
jgi:hypothetical protein